jgi:glycosyltransferase involved in cell wall biosynthesis
MQLVIAERHDTSCLIVGDGLAKDRLKQLIVKLGLDDFFVFTGRISHDIVPQYLSFADIGIACFPSLDYFNYASNIKVFEYLASGIPTNVSPTGDLPYYVDYGKAGIVADSNVATLSNTLTELLADDSKRKDISRYAKAYVKNFDWSRLANELINVYARLN